MPRESPACERQGRTVREIADELGYSRSLVHKTIANGVSIGVANAAH